MRRTLGILLSLSLALLITGCNIFVDLDTPKSEELKETYDFYEKSVNTIRTKMNISPEEADEAFITLVENGLDREIGGIIKSSQNDSTYNVTFFSKSLKVMLNNNSISEIYENDLMVYPTKEVAEIEITDKTVKKELISSIEYYDNIILNKIPSYSKNKDSENIIKYLEESISRLDSDTDKYLEYMDNDNLSEDTRTACQNVKTAFYGVSSTVLKPMLDIFKGVESDGTPEYGVITVDAQTLYLDAALKLIK